MWCSQQHEASALERRPAFSLALPCPGDEVLHPDLPYTVPSWPGLGLPVPVSSTDNSRACFNAAHDHHACMAMCACVHVCSMSVCSMHACVCASPRRRRQNLSTCSRRAALRKSVPGQGWNLNHVVPPVRHQAADKKGITSKSSDASCFSLGPPPLCSSRLPSCCLWIFAGEAPGSSVPAGWVQRKPPPCGMWAHGFCGGRVLMMHGRHGATRGHGLGSTDTLTLLVVGKKWSMACQCPSGT